jgi:deoxyribonuclease V
VDLSDAVDSPESVELVGGADVAFLTNSPGSAGEADAAPIFGGRFPAGAEGTDAPSGVTGVTALACVVILDTRQRQVVETVFATAPVLFPYIPGLLTFREGPAVLAALGELTALPGVMLYDGTGIAHPRGMGIASHMAVLTGIPSIGCAKSPLVGSCEEPGMEKGDWSYIYYRKRVVGTCLRTRRGVTPMYISPGSGFSVDGACRFALALTGKYRLPEPTRLAHQLVTEHKGLMVRGES